MVSSHENIDPVFLQIIEMLGNRSFAVREVFRIRDYEIGGVFRPESWQILGEELSPLSPVDISEYQKFHKL